MPQELLIEGFVARMQFLEYKTREFTAGQYLLSIVEIVNRVQQNGSDSLFIVNNYIIGIIEENDSKYLFNSHSNNENDNVSSFGTAVLKFDTLYSLDNYIRSVYYNAYQLPLFFWMCW